MRGIVGDVHGIEVVASTLVRVATCAGHAVVIARRGVVQVVEIDGLHVGPLREVARNGDGLRRRGGGHRACAFVAADVGDHLPVVVVAEAAAHGLDVAAEFLVVKIDKEGLARRQHTALKSHGAIGKEALGHPFVPASDEDELGIVRKRVLPLLIKVEPFTWATVSGRWLAACMKAASDVVGDVLAHADRHALGFAGRVMPAGHLRREVEPRPLVLAIAEPRMASRPGP